MRLSLQRNQTKSTMDSLKDIISSFKVNTVDERNLLNSNEAPNVFYKVAECMLAGHFLELNRARLGVRSLRLSPDAEQALLNYDWPGNVRELEHVISRAAIKALGRNGSRQAMLSLDAALLDIPVASMALSDVAEPGDILAEGDVQPLRLSIEACQREQIRLALVATGDNWSAAARLLELDASNLHKLARRLGLK